MAASSPFRKLVACTTVTNAAPHKDTPLGLRLESETGPVDTLVIDNIDRPIADR
jgi:uncharacterized protein (TIGR03435 family)